MIVIVDDAEPCLKRTQSHTQKRTLMRQKEKQTEQICKNKPSVRFCCCRILAASHMYGDYIERARIKPLFFALRSLRFFAASKHWWWFWRDPCDSNYGICSICSSRTICYVHHTTKAAWIEMPVQNSKSTSFVRRHQLEHWAWVWA